MSQFNYFLNIMKDMESHGIISGIDDDTPILTEKFIYMTNNFYPVLKTKKTEHSLSNAEFAKKYASTNMGEGALFMATVGMMGSIENDKVDDYCYVVTILASNQLDQFEFDVKSDLSKSEKIKMINVTEQGRCDDWS